MPYVNPAVSSLIPRSAVGVVVKHENEQYLLLTWLAAGLVSGRAQGYTSAYSLYQSGRSREQRQQCRNIVDINHQIVIHSIKGIERMRCAYHYQGDRCHQVGHDFPACDVQETH